MKLWDEKYRLFGIINIIDLVVVVAILAGAYAAYRVLTPKPAEGPKASAGVDVTFDVVCPLLRKSYVATSQVMIGDPIAKASDGKVFGEVTAVRAEPIPGDVWDATHQKIIQYESTFSEDIIISAKTKGEPTESGVVVGNVVIHSGQPIAIMTSTFQCDTAYLANMKISEKN